MTAAEPWTTHGVDLYDDGLGGLKAYRGHEFVGAAFPSVVHEAAGSWFGRRRGETARRFDTRHAALAHLVGGCPDCTCDQALCESDETGDSCLDCGACLHGCPEDEHDMTKETR
jgi:hypothetical protein